MQYPQVVHTLPQSLGVCVPVDAYFAPLFVKHPQAIQYIDDVDA